MTLFKISERRFSACEKQIDTEVGAMKGLKPKQQRRERTKKQEHYQWEAKKELKEFLEQKEEAAKTLTNRAALLCKAVEGNHVKLVSGYLAKGVDPNIETVDGRLPILLAVQSDNVEVVDLLLYDKGCSYRNSFLF
jgi:hypothetical protein